MTILRSIKETAERLGVAESTLANWRVSGKRGPAYVKISNKVLYRDEDIEAFIAARLRTSTSQEEVAA